MSDNCVSSEDFDPWEVYLSWQSCIENVLLAWDKKQKLKIEVILKFSEVNDIDVTMNVQGIEIPTEIVQRISLVSCFSKEKSKVSDEKFYGFVLSGQIVDDDFDKLEHDISGYLEFIYYMFVFNLEVDITYYSPWENDGMCREFGFEGSEDVQCIRHAVFPNLSPSSHSPTMEMITLKNAPESMSRFGDVKVTLSFAMTSRQASNFLSCEYDIPLLCVYCFGPCGLPVFKSDLELFPFCKSSPAFKRILRESDCGFLLTDVGFIEAPCEFQLPHPYCLQEFSSSKKIFKDRNLVLMLYFDVEQQPHEVVERAELCQLLQKEFEEVFELNCEDLKSAYKRVVKQATVNEKSAKINNNNENAIGHTVSCISDIVAGSTNILFRDTCLNLMKSATTQGFEVDLHVALQKYSEKKQMRKRKRKSNEEIEWQVLQEATSHSS